MQFELQKLYYYIIRCCHVLNAGLGEISPSAQRYNLPERKRWVLFVVDTSGRTVWQLSKVRFLTLHLDTWQRVCFLIIVEL